MPQDAFTIRKVVSELKDIIVGAKINRVSQPDKDDVYLLIYSKIGAKTLVLSTNAQTCRVGFTSREKPNPKVAPNFCMLLRKHLLGCAVENISTLGSERIVKIDFSGRNDFKETVRKTIYHEIMGKYSNVILTENGIILGCLKNAPLDVATTRVTLAGAPYKLPKSQDKADIFDEKESVSRLSRFSGGDAATFISDNFLGVAYSTAEEAASIIANKKSAEEKYAALKNFLLDPPVSPIIAGEGKTRDFFVTSFRAKDFPAERFPSVLDAQDAFYSRKEAAKEFSDRKKSLSDKINALYKKQSKRLQGETEKLLEAKDYDLLRIKGELITANLYRLKDGMTECELENWYDGYKPLKITLDKRLSPNANAQKYFKKYAKEKRTVEILAPEREKTERELEYLKSVAFEIENASDADDFRDIEEELISADILAAPKQRKKQEEESAYRVYKINGFTVKCGKNNVQNDRLTGRAFKDDVWLHTKNYRSAHVIIETKGEGVPDDVILAAAEICAFYSDAKGGTKVPVDHTLKKFVRKPPKARAGSVIYTDYRTLFVTPREHAEYKI